MDEDCRVRVFGFTHPDLERITVPVGEPCNWCEEAIAAYELGFSVMSLERDHAKRIYMHRACFLRGVIGSVAHIERRCSCFVPGAGDDDDPNLTKREAAEAAMIAYRRRHRVGTLMADMPSRYE